MSLRNSLAITTTFILIFLSSHVESQEAATPKNASGDSRRRSSDYPPRMPAAEVEVYKSIGEVELNAYFFKPKGHQAEDRRPAVVFFFGGGWNAGSPAQFEPHCEYLAERGMVAVTVDYRVKSRHNVKAVECVADAKSAVRWLRANASRLGIDPDRIVAGGGSAGGHLAACTALIKRFDAPDEDASISSVPNATALFNPALILAAVDGANVVAAAKQAELDARMGVDSVELSPYHHISEQAPPTIIFHGKEDVTVPYETVELFTQAMQKAGNRCELIGFEGQGHGFFNAGRNQGEYFEKTIKQLDAFLVSLGFLDEV